MTPTDPVTKSTPQPESLPDQDSTAGPGGRRSSGRAGISAPRAAGLGYVAAWVVGLALWPTNLSVDASHAAVVTSYAEHRGVAAAQYLLVEGLAAVALAVVVTRLGRTARPRARDLRGRIVMGAGIGAAIVSMIECVLGFVLVGASGRSDGASLVGALFDLINRLDGVKMLAFALMASAAVGLARGDGPLPRWLGYTAVLLAASMAASGVGYLWLNPTVAQAAAASLPLVLIWVTGAGWVLGRRPPQS